MSTRAALVIGANGGIGQELVKQLRKTSEFASVHAVSRNSPQKLLDGVIYHQMESSEEDQVKAFCQTQLEQDIHFAYVICCIGSLHGQTSSGLNLQPEKRIEDINSEQLAEYFATNTIIPALWLRYIEPLMQAEANTRLVFFSARVASISDNNLGGWYGYRASKAALNMLIKTAQIEYQRRAKNVSIVSYHPGTVDTALSKPFQSNVPKGKLFTPQFSVSQLLKHLPDLKPEQGPHYIDWLGQNISW